MKSEKSESRYARQEALRSIGKEGQKKIRKATAAIAGCGALGSVSAELLCRAGIGRLILIDHDVVDLTNLQRQALFNEADVGKTKVAALSDHLKRINKDVTLIAKPAHLDASTIDLLDDADCIIDGTDDVDTRLLMNKYSRKNSTPWIYGGAIAERGLVYVTTKDSPCFSCIFPMIRQGETCEEYGILNSCSHIVAAVQASECIKIITGKQPVKGLVHINAAQPSMETFGVKKNPACKACKGEFSMIMKKTGEGLTNTSDAFTIQKCKTRAGWSARPVRQTRLDLSKLKKRFQIVLETPILLVVKKEGFSGEIIVHNYGEILFKQSSDEKKMKAIAAEIYEAGQQ
ncbi:HesA/MoeB/ThiF family protein [Candidatus Woesearchaeota archaeon]|nr:HesA/MoeB/ThiF family protein [Candidatus Woesearchaeota archaeon]